MAAPRARRRTADIFTTPHPAHSGDAARGSWRPSLGASLDDDDTALPRISMHQTRVLQPSRLREREAE